MKFHWYCFSFASITSDKYSIGHAYRGEASKKPAFSKPVIDELKGYAKVPSGAVLMSISYLGKMTTEEFEGENT